MHPLDDILTWLPELDFAVLGHGFAPHGRDYLLIVEDCLGGDPGRHELTFTHCVRADCETRVRDDVWPKSWSDEFTDYKRWQEAKEPDGYVWGVNWSNAYPGITKVGDSQLAAEWSRRLGKPMYEVTIETNQYLLRLVFHSVSSQKVSDDTSTISQTIIPLKP